MKRVIDKDSELRDPLAGDAEKVGKMDLKDVLDIKKEALENDNN